VIEERSGRGSLIIASQLPLENWHETLPEVAQALGVGFAAMSTYALPCR